MNVAATINEALRNYGKPILLIGKPGDGKLNHLTSTLDLSCISLAWESHFPKELVEYARRCDIRRLVFDEVDKLPERHHAPLKELLDTNEIHCILVANNLEAIPEAITQRCLIFNLHQ